MDKMGSSNQHLQEIGGSIVANGFGVQNRHLRQCKSFW
jgi:hypothetical protein